VDAPTLHLIPAGFIPAAEPAHSPDAPELVPAPAGDGGASPCTLAVWEWPGEDPPLLFCHATGFHGRSWDHIVRRFPGRHTLALDFRGHGRSGKPAPPIPWRHFAHDLLAVAQHFGIRRALGVGHSMGGHAVVSAAIAQPEIFAALLLVDPVIFPPAWYSAPLPDSSFIARRRNRWASPREMFDRFRARPPFATWQPEALQDYCDYALLPDGDSFVLACPPAVEAAIYCLCNTPECNLYAGIPSLRQPVTVLRAGAGVSAATGVLDLSASPTAPDLATRFAHGRDVFLPHRNHYIPMEAPELVAAEIAHFCSNKSGL
jgi:pimeloyl-ACP methyl ester carboxylesterase